MGYIDSFLEFQDCGKKKDALRLSGELALHSVKEFIGLHKRKIDEDFVDPKTLGDWYSVMRDSLQFRLLEAYFRPEVHGVEKIPRLGALIVSHHSGMWGIDGITACASIYRETSRVVYGVTHDIVSDSDLCRSFGLISGSPLIAEKVLSDDNLLLVYPGGAEAVAKKMSERYMVRPVGGFAEDSLGYILVAASTEVPIVPLANIGADESFIQVCDLKKEIGGVVERFYSALPSSAKKVLERPKELWDSAQGAPFVLNPLPLPVKNDIYIGSPLDVGSWLKDFPVTEYRELRNVNRFGVLNKTDYRSYVWLRGILSAENRRVMNAVQCLIDRGLGVRLRKAL